LDTVQTKTRSAVALRVCFDQELSRAGSRLDVGVAHLLQAGEFGDAARDDVLFVDEEDCDLDYALGAMGAWGAESVLPRCQVSLMPACR
jgi:hypothetical protein